MQQFNAVFFEEVSEHLSNMESLLLDIDVTSPNLEDLNAIFRAAHSIKGGAGIFGFSDMTEVTHILETLLDKLRKEELTLTTEMIDAFLKAGDILSAQKAVHQEEGEPVDEDDIKEICTLLAQLSSGEATPAIHSAPETVQTESVDIASPVVDDVEEITPITTLSDPSEQGIVKKITFLVEADEDPSNLFEDLTQYGALSKSSEVIHGFTQWRLALSDCSASDEELFDSVSFIADPDSILIVEVKPVEEESGEPVNDKLPEITPSDEDQGFGLFDDDIEVDASHDIDHEEDEGFGLFADEDAIGAEIVPIAAEEKSGEASVEEALCEAPLVVKEKKETNENVKDQTPRHLEKRSSSAKKQTKSTPSKAPSISETSIRVNTEKVDQLINQVGELVITQAMLMQISNDLDPSVHDILLNRLTQLERNTRDLQESVMSIRMMPISFVFGRFPRVVRDLSGKLNKKIELRLVGDETELDKGLVEQLADPLTHLIRNSIDHGIEMPDVRVANGKSETGIITLFAFYEGGNVVINISDDGAGLNRDKILEKALERGLDVSDNISDSDVYQLIFSAGFSTADKVTDVSGRGVGMDVVKRNIHSMGGQVEIHSEAGIGSTISIRLPLTLAILDGMSISVAGQVYIIPLTFIAESLQPQAKDIKTINGTGTVVKVRGDYIPLLALHELFNIETDIKQASDGILVLLESNNKKIALLVDQLEGQQQVVLKSLETNFHAIPCISGATIMGDGTVALILDVAGLVSASD